MQRPSVNYLIDLFTLLVMLAIACTGLIMRFVLPPGSGGRGLVLWGLGRHEWGSVHFWTTVAAAVLLVVHVWLHWVWVCTVTARLLHPRARVQPPTPAARRRMGAAFLLGVVLLLAGFTFLARASVGEDAASAERHESDAPRGGSGQRSRLGAP